MLTTVDIRMLRWRLREVMARGKVSNRELAKRLGVHETSVSRLRGADTMPRIDGETLEQLCKALDCTPSDLLEYVPESEADRHD